MRDAVQPQADIHINNIEKRNQYLSKLIVQVKPIEKTSSHDQLIVITTIRKDNQKAVAVNVRKLSQLDSLVQHIKRQYGGHLIPFIKSDLYFQQNLQLEKLTPLIQEYLNDIRTHLVCQRDIKFYQFLLYQSVEFPEQMAYQKVLSNAADLSRKYLNTIFARKQITHHIQSLNQFNRLYKQTQRFKQDFKPLKQICLNYLNQHQGIQDLMTNLCQLSGQMGQSVYPSDRMAIRIRQKIKKMDKYLGQIDQAYNRVTILGQQVRQLQGNIYKGLHEDNKILQKNEALLLTWSNSLSKQFQYFLSQAVDVCQNLATNIYQLKASQLKQQNQINQELYNSDW